MTTSAAVLPTSMGAIRELSRAALWKTPIVLGVVTLASAILFLGFPRPGDSPFILATDGDWFAMPTLVLPSVPTTILITILLLGLTLFSVLRAVRKLGRQAL